MFDSGWLKDLMIVLATAGVLVPLLGWLRIGIVPGFLVAGVLLGPGGLGHLVGVAPWLEAVTLSEPGRVEPFAELGVLFLLFLIGLEFSFDRLWSMRRWCSAPARRSSSSQRRSSSFGRLVYAQLSARRWSALAFALSSTAVGSQVLIETRRFATPAGRLSLAVLLFQDLMVVPVVIVVDLLVGRRGGLPGARAARHRSSRSPASASSSSPGALWSGRAAPRRRHRQPRGRVAIAMFLAIGTAILTASLGLSAALGAFLAGILLGENEYRHQLEVDLEPFKGLLLGLFFMTVGMSLDLVLAQLVAVSSWPVVALMVVLKIAADVAAGACGGCPCRGRRIGLRACRGRRVRLRGLPLARGDDPHQRRGSRNGDNGRRRCRC